MKKVLLGCGVALVAFVVLGGGGFYFFLYKPFMSDYVEGAVQLAEVSQLEGEVEDQSSYAPPDEGTLTADQVARFVRVQHTVRDQMGARFERLEQKYEELDRELNREGRSASYREVLGAWRDLSDLLVKAKRAQVEALNAEGFSVEEYQWVRGAVYQAAGAVLPMANMGEMLQAARQAEGAPGGQDRLAAMKRMSEQAIPEKNRRLVAPHAEVLEENLVMAWFGL